MRQQLTLIAPLDAPILTVGQAGGKGATLNAMIRAGLPVPPGFVILTAAYQQFVSDHALTDRIERQWMTCDPTRPASFEDASTLLRAAFEQGHMAASLTDSITRHYDRLGGDAGIPVAVRSSATAEDLPDASFAGQQDTYLNIGGSDAVLAATKRCWASLWTARAMAYRFRQGISPHDVSLAVVVQVMAQATASGVLFTINPVTGNLAEMVINATWGLGEALVSGRVNPDTIVVDKPSGRVKHVDLGDKAVMTAAVAGGTAEIAVEADRRNRQAIDAAQVAELARWGRLLESHFGHAQDIEWAVAGGNVVLLQSRPVTTAGTVEPVPGDDAWPPVAVTPQTFDLWTTYDVGERWPEPVTPLTWSTGSTMIQQNMDETLEGLKAPYAGKIQWARRSFGHVYLNEGAIIHAYTDGFGLPMGLIAAGLTGVVPVTADNDRMQWGKIARHAPVFWQMFTAWERNIGRFEQDFDQIDRWVDEFMVRDLSAASDIDLWQEGSHVWLARGMKYMRYHSNATSLSMTGFNRMESSMAQWMGDKEIAQTLICGLAGIIAAEIVPALWRMARQLDELGLAQIVLDNPPELALAHLRQTAQAQPMLVQFDLFLRRHGHRCRTEAEWRHPRWVEAPAQVIESLAGYLRAGSGFDPAQSVARAVREREAATAAVETRLNPLQRASFRRDLKQLQRLVRARDNGQHYLVKLLLPLRHIYATLAERWAQRDWLAASDDFFFLVVPEIEAVLAYGEPRHPPLDLKKSAADRRAAYDYWFTQPMPDVLDAHGEPLDFHGQRESSADGQVLIGLAASRGLVTGVARVVLNPQDAATIKPGEILVTRATDPGWTPVFSVIGGAVIEIGGMLSHGAIVAREYGLPAVVNIAQATQLIGDGQTITVDGAKGRVVLTDRV